jgi:hypothetical protein
MTKDPDIALPPSRAWFSVLALAGSLLCGQAPAQAQQFSADLITTQGDGAAAVPAGKLWVFDDKVRIETPELADGYFLIDGAKPTAYFVRPASRIFMDARQSSPLTRIFVPVDADNPCRQWQAMAKLAEAVDRGDWRCERTGEARIGGRSAIAYRVVSASGRVLLCWIDSVYKFPLQIRSEDGVTVTTANVRAEPQPALLFEIPAGFRKFDPRIMIEQIKQSDVWVAGQKDAERAHP